LIAYSHPQIIEERAMGQAEASDEEPGIPEIGIVGDLSDHETEFTEKLLQVPLGGECVLYFDSPGGNPYTGLALLTLIRVRGLQATGVVAGECSSAAIWPFAACRKRFVLPYSVLLFHPMKWQSEEHVGLAEAAEWARHFQFLEAEMDRLLAELFEVPPDRLERWLSPGTYVTGRELAAAGLAEMLTLAPFLTPPAPPERPKPRRKR